MKSILSLATVAIIMAAFAPSSEAASFNCNRRLSETELAICSNAELSSLDSQMSAMYFRALTDRPGYAPYLKREQRQWIEERNACGGDVGCLLQSYIDRNANLMLLEGPP